GEAVGVLRNLREAQRRVAEAEEFPAGVPGRGLGEQLVDRAPAGLRPGGSPVQDQVGRAHLPPAPGRRGSESSSIVVISGPYSSRRTMREPASRQASSTKRSCSLATDSLPSGRYQRATPLIDLRFHRCPAPSSCVMAHLGSPR